MGPERTLFRSLPERRRRQVFGLIALTLIGGTAELASIAAVVPLIGLLAGHPVGAPIAPPAIDLVGSIVPHSMLAALIVFVLATLAAAAARLAIQAATQRIVLGAGHELTVEIQRRTLLQPYSYHVRQHSSALVASLEKVEGVTFGVMLPLVQAGAALLIGGFIVAALVRVEPREAAFVAIFLAGAYAAVTLAIRPALTRESAQVAGAYDQRVKLVQNSVGAIRDIIIDSSQPAYLAAFTALNARFVRARASIAVTSAAPRFLIEAIGTIVIAAFAALLAARGGGLLAALPALGALALGAQRLLPLLQQLHQAANAIAANRGMLRDIARLLSLPDCGVESADGATAPLPFRRSIELDRLSFTYEGGARPAVEDINLSIPRGARVTLVGRTGSGKTTLGDLVMGLLEPTSGEVRIDGQRLDSAQARAWQRNIAHVPQAIFLTDDSIARNIALSAPGRPLDLQRLGDAVRNAQLAGFIAELPEGLDTRVGERGIRLSGGQRQRVGLARALYKGADFLVLDEPTSALDPETEQAVMEVLSELQRSGRTILVITHRDQAGAGSTTVIRLDEGRIGPPA